MKKILTAIWTYLKDWKNLLTHTLIGIAILVVAVYLPVKPVVRVIFLLLVVTANVLRMRWEKRHAREKVTERE